MKPSLIAAALFGTVAAGGLAYAQTAPTPTAAPKPMKGDTNADGKVTRAEFVRQAETRFAMLDTNRDGSLTREEQRAGHGRKSARGPRDAMGGPFEPTAGQDTPPPPTAGGDAMRGPRRPGGGMARLDTDGDGKVTRAEYDTQSTKRFARMDTNGDGTVDATEMAALPGGGRMGGRMDADGSGTLTRAEFDAQSGQRFARMDMNADGVIDAAELQAGPMGRGGKGGGARRARPAPAPMSTPTPPAPTGA
ncbi:MAG: hypothetical protein V4537_10590 [Pseudomonadota bacterium]